ncbi:hypothetical protein BV898_14430 [Hypsibius exemplaris]|uniref:G-protein coupled receptors family 1 profile domain-containing protein n=1 Tax=Hypsibius exemplaris TaxID=2072580 RepID=A0A9X6RJH6_HYPEX|nr:hypothetical protein BV898_14430 [Hypsibius exemplaris]
MDDALHTNCSIFPNSLHANSSLPVNASNTNSSLLPAYTQTNLWAWTIVELVINAIGAGSNAMLLAASLIYPPLRRNSSNVLICHCILLDLIMCAISNPGSILASQVFNDILDRTFCLGWGFIRFFTMFLDNWVHAILAVNRFIAVVTPFRYKYFVQKPFLLLGVAAPWVIVFLICIIPSLDIHHLPRYLPSNQFVGTSVGCIVNYPVRNAKTNLLIGTFGGFIPSGIAGVCYVAVFIKARITLWRRVGDMGQSFLSRYEMAKILFVCLLWYILSATMPGNFITVASFPLTHLVTRALQFISSAVNPVFFIVISQNYRSGFMAVLKCNGSVRTAVGPR